MCFPSGRTNTNEDENFYSESGINRFRINNNSLNITLLIGNSGILEEGILDS